MNAQYKQALRDGKNLEKIIRHGLSTITPLDADCYMARDYWNKDRKSQFGSRVVVRCLCANIEARLYLYRRMALQVLPLSKVSLASNEEEILLEERTLIRNGVQETKPKWLHIKDSVKESLRLFAKAFGASFQPDCSGKGYTSLCEIFAVRNRLMHPKNTFDLGVTEETVKTADVAIDWLNEQHVAMVNVCQTQSAANVQKGLDELKKKR